MSARTTRCPVCGAVATVSEALGACKACLTRGETSRAEANRRALRLLHRLPEEVPRGGPARCDLCVNACAPAEGEAGFCGVRRVEGGQLVGGEETAVLDWYRDPLPTNCVSSWICPAHGDRGHNLAVFCRGCAFDCLFCQNWSHRDPARRSSTATVEELLGAVVPETRCVCFFGGDPTPQIAFVEAFAAALRRERPDVRVCFETNGSASRERFEAMLELSARSGGIVKMDLKAHDERLHRALTGATSRRTLRNLARGAERARGRASPLVVASTLLVPGYVDAAEVRKLASRIAELHAGLPYALLAFHPAFALSDLDRTRASDADEALAAAEAEGLTTVRVGNQHLLW